MVIDNHTFVICAYKESMHLRACVESLKKQSVLGKIICTTSTPNSHVESICQEYNVPLYVNSESRGIAADWNFAYSKTETEYVTIAHQDDIYDPLFLKETLDCIKKSSNPLIAFTDYYEIRGEEKVVSNRILQIKRIMTSPWRIRMLWSSEFVARRIFSFGCPVCCPSVTFVRSGLPNTPLFDESFKVNCDWMAWVNIRKIAGDFIYCKKILMGHRIHEESETTNKIHDNTRSKEDMIILEMLVPKSLAKIIHYFYVKGQKSNELK